jgi:UDP-N-acetylmuramate--alanine ligase
METMERTGRGVCYVFQPHGYGPARLMKEGYIATFSSYLRETDLLILLPIYYAGGTASKDISSRDIADRIKALGKNVEVVENRNDIIVMHRKWESYVVFGARDDSLSDLAEEIAGKLRLQHI